TRRSDHVLLFVSKHNATNLRLKIGLVPHELFSQMFPREFERDELMMIMCTARRRQRFIGDGVVAGVAWQVIAPRAAVLAYGAVPAEVQTKLQALPVKRASPIKGVIGAKVVPFDRDSNFVHIAVQRAPSVFHFTPGVLFGCATGIHLANYECCRGECKAGFFPPAHRGPISRALTRRRRRSARNQAVLHPTFQRCAPRRMARCTRAAWTHNKPPVAEPSLLRIPVVLDMRTSRKQVSASPRYQARNRGCLLPASKLHA